MSLKPALSFVQGMSQMLFVRVIQQATLHDPLCNISSIFQVALRCGLPFFHLYPKFELPFLTWGVVPLLPCLKVTQMGALQISKIWYCAAGHEICPYPASVPAPGAQSAGLPGPQAQEAS